MNIYMEKAKQNADNGIKNKEGGPFGAIITDKEEILFQMEIIK